MTRLPAGRTLLVGLFVAAAYVATARLATGVAVLSAGYAPFWPAAGLASGTLAVLGLRYAPAIAIGSLVVSVLTGYPPAAAAWFMVVDAAEATAVAWLVRRAAIDFGLTRALDVGRFALAALAGGVVGATLSGPVYVVVTSSHPQPPWVVWIGWTAGHAIAHMIVGGALLVWSSPPREAPARAGRAEHVLVMSALAVVTAWVFLGSEPNAMRRPFLVLALVTWTAVRLGQRAVTATVLGISGVAAWAVARGTGPYTAADGPFLQIFLGTCGLAGFSIAAVAAEREEAAFLREREARYRVLADASPNQMWIGRADGTVELFNLAAQAYLGIREPGRELLDLVQPDDRQLLAACWQIDERRARPDPVEVRLRRHDGAYRWHLTVIVPVSDGPGHEPRWIGTATDIHDRKLAEIELASWRAHYERAQAIGQLGSWEADLDQEHGRLVWSSELFRIFGTRPAAFDGRVASFYAFVHPADRNAVQEAVRRAVSEGVRYQIDHRIVRPDGEVRWVHEEGDVTTTPEGHRRLVGICRDITERVHAEEDRRTLETSLLHAQKLESLGILAVGIAHDFNNLLVGILGNASLALLDLPPESPARESLQRIETSSMRAAELVRQLLAYSGKSVLSFERVDVSALVREMGDLLAAAISKRAVLDYRLAPGLPPVEADSTQLRQVVMNLITNASDALGEGGGTITITTGLVTVGADAQSVLGTTVTPGDYVRLDVADTGVGMAPDTAARIFEPFFSTKFTGRGLGLAAVQGIVRSHRGSIQLTTAPDRGTTFTVLLPAGQGAASTALASPPRPAFTQLFSGTVLVVDDEDSVRQAVSRMLQRFGLTVIAARNGQQGIDLFRQHRQDLALVLLDMTMPDLGGSEVVAVIRRIDPRVPIIVSSGYSRQDAVTAFGAHSVEGFLQKPFRPQELADVIRGALANAGPG